MVPFQLSANPIIQRWLRALLRKTFRCWEVPPPRKDSSNSLWTILLMRTTAKITRPRTSPWISSTICKKTSVSMSTSLRVLQALKTVWWLSKWSTRLTSRFHMKPTRRLTDGSATWWAFSSPASRAGAIRNQSTTSEKGMIKITPTIAVTRTTTITSLNSSVRNGTGASTTTLTVTADR